jgi:hypothetical protein
VSQCCALRPRHFFAIEGAADIVLRWVRLPIHVEQEVAVGQAVRPSTLHDRQLFPDEHDLVRMTDFPAPSEHRRLLDHVLVHQEEFEESGIIGPEGELGVLDYGVRKSRTFRAAVWRRSGDCSSGG